MQVIAKTRSIRITFNNIDTYNFNIITYCLISETTKNISRNEAITNFA